MMVKSSDLSRGFSVFYSGLSKVLLPGICNGVLAPSYCRASPIGHIRTCAMPLGKLKADALHLTVTTKAGPPDLISNAEPVGRRQIPNPGSYSAGVIQLK